MRIQLLRKTSVILMMSLMLALPTFAQEADSTKVKKKEKKEEKKPLSLKSDRSFDLKTDQGTWMSLDVSPDGNTIAFDMLGDIYTIPMLGGKATRIIGEMSFESHPKFSPDGKHLLFNSDRDGNENVWIKELATGDSTQITKHKTHHIQSAEWTPDGNYIVASKGGRNYKLYMYHKDGGKGVQLTKKPDSQKDIEPAFGPDERFLWYATRHGAWQYNAQLPQYQLSNYDRETGEVQRMTSRYGSAFSPTLSPDGKWLVYGTRHNSETGLIKRNLLTGDEDWLAYPVQRDEQESIAPLGVLPAMSFTPDSQHFLASYGGKIWKIPMAGGDATNVPFDVDEKIALGPLVQFEYPISDNPKMVVNQIRDAVLSPDGTKLAFTALNKLYVMDYPNGTPKRISSSEHIEAFPTWGNNSQLAFVRWEGESGYIYKVNTLAKRLSEQKLTAESAIYTELNWDRTSNRIVAMRGSSRSFRNAIDPFSGDMKSHLVWVSGSGGNVTLIDQSRGRSVPHFVKGKDRIYLYSGKKGLLSIRWDGTDEKTHLKVTGITTYPTLNPEEAHHGHEPSMMMPTVTEPAKKPSNAAVIMMAPEGDKAMAKINNHIYVVTVPMVGKDAVAINVADPKSAAFPSWQLTEFGGEFPQWTDNASRVTWSLGNAFFDYDLAEAKKVTKELKAKKKAEAEKKKKEAEAKAKAKADEKEDGEKETDEDESEGDKDKEDEGYKANEMRIKVKVDRDIPQGTVLLSNARVITMDGNKVIEKGDILIVNNRIKAVGAAGSLTVPSGAETIDLSGKTITPGFVDTHAHMWPNWGIHKEEVWIYAANVAYGVTTTRDPQTATTDVLTYADMITSGDMVGPRIYSTGPGVGYWSYNLKSKKQASKVLKQYSEYYNTKTIKMYLTGNRQHRQWIIEAAKEQKLMPTTEGGLDFKLNVTQILDGYPGHEHTFPIYPLFGDFKQLVLGVGTTYTPTLLVSYGGPWAENYYYSRENPNGDEKLNYFTPKGELDAKSRRRPGWFMDEEHIFARHAEFVNELVKAGGSAGVGSHGQLQGLGYHWELWSVQSGGMSNHDALKVATILGAKAIGLGTDLGSIEVGKLADLVIMQKNPLANIKNTNTITHVMKNGRLYDGNNLNQVYPKKVEMPKFRWEAGGPMGVPGYRN